MCSQQDYDDNTSFERRSNLWLKTNLERKTVYITRDDLQKAFKNTAKITRQSVKLKIEKAPARQNNNLLACIKDCSEHIFVRTTNNLLTFLPEECVAELAVSRKRMEKKKNSAWQICLRLCEDVIPIIWDLYIQIPFKNLMLPSDDSGDRQVDE